MRITANTMTNQLLQMELPFQCFIQGTLASHLVNEKLDPVELLYSELPATQALQAMEEDDLCYELEQACLRASRYHCEDEHLDYLTPIKIKLNKQDLAQCKQLLFPLHGMRLVHTPDKPRSA